MTRRASKAPEAIMVTGRRCLWLLVIAFSGLLPPASPGTLSAESVAASKQRSSLCTFCKDIVQKMQDILDANKTFDDFRDVFVGICTVAIDVTFERGHLMCPGLVDAYGPVIQFVLTHKAFDPTVLCQDLHVCSSTSVGTRKSKLTREQDDKAFLRRYRDVMWELQVNAPLKHKHMPVLKEGDVQGLFSGVLPEAPRGRKRSRKAGDTIRILQFSDIHLDHLYQEGSATDCGLYICCRTMWPGKGSAGHYGEYSCDLPRVTLDLFLKEIGSLDPPPDIVIYTGDNPPHDIWMESFSGQIEATQSLVEYVVQGLGNMTIYPALGNHESFPQSQYFAPKWEYQNLTKSLSKIWQKWLKLDASQLATVSTGGYYTTLVEGFPGLRILALNTDYGYGVNFYTFLNDENPYFAQYQDWVYSTLHAAEKAGEKVLVIGHIPPSDSSALSDYGETLLNISKIYYKTIIAFLLGHTHKDQLTLVKDDSGVYETLLIAPSVTPYVDQNPSYRIFEMDPNTYELLDFQQYHMNLTKANELYHQGKEPQWEHVYTATSLYKMANISTASWAGLAERMATNSTLIDLYHYNRYGQSRPKYQKCDKICQRDMLCEINNVISSHMYECLA